MDYHELERYRKPLITYSNYMLGQVNSAKKILTGKGDILSAFNQHRAGQGHCNKLFHIYEDGFSREITLQIQNPFAGVRTTDVEVAKKLAVIGLALPQYDVKQMHDAICRMHKM